MQRTILARMKYNLARLHEAPSTVVLNLRASAAFLHSFRTAGIEAPSLLQGEFPPSCHQCRYPSSSSTTSIRLRHPVCVPYRLDYITGTAYRSTLAAIGHVGQSGYPSSAHARVRVTVLSLQTSNRQYSRARQAPAANVTAGDNFRHRYRLPHLARRIKDSDSACCAALEFRCRKRLSRHRRPGVLARVRAGERSWLIVDHHSSVGVVLTNCAPARYAISQCFLALCVRNQT